MRRSSSSVLRVACAAVLAIAAAWLLARALPRRAAVDLARGRTDELSPRLADALAHAEGDVSIAWFGTRAEELPSSWRALPGDVAAMLELLARSSPRVRVSALDPSRDPVAAELATRFGARPIPARTVLADGWREEPVWSALRIADGARGAVLVPAVTPELAPRLQELVAAHLEALAHPKRARVAIAAPDRYLRLRTELGRTCDAFDSEFDADARLDDDVDLLVWIEPSAATAKHARALRELVARGGSAWIAGSRHDARVVDAVLDGGPASVAIDTVLAELGARTLPGVVVERRGAAGEIATRIGSIGELQDFRALAADPGGTLWFRSPTALEPDATRLAELGFAWRPLACSSAESLLADVERGPISIDRVASSSRQGARALLVLLESRDPWRGSVVACGSASPFLDEEIAREADGASPHRELVRALANELASPARVVRRGIAREAPPGLPELSAKERLLARALVVAAPALLAALVAVLAARGAAGMRLRVRLPVASIAVVVALAVVALASALLPSSAAIDLTREREHALPDELARLANDAERRGARVSIEATFSPLDELPPELRPVARRARDRAREVAALSTTWSYSERAPAAGDVVAGLDRLRVTSTLDEASVVRAVYASIVVTPEGDASRASRLDLARPRDADELDLRLGIALWTALGGARPVVAFAGGEERLSPAEALLEYERRGRFAPRGAARFELARSALARAGFDVRAIDPDRPAMPERCEVLVWLAPRRDVRPLGLELARLLARGGRAFVALQPWRARPIHRAARGGALALWPEAQFPDLDRDWLPRLGVRVVPEIVCDARSATALLDAKVERTEAGARAEIVREPVTSPVIVRAAPTEDAREELAARALPELVLPMPARFEIDRVELARRGLAARTLYATSERAWSRPWSGGDLGDEVLAPSEEIGTSYPLAIAVRGRFAGPEIEPAWGDATANESAAGGALIAVGCSEAFTDAALAQSPAAERFLVQSVAALCLPREIAELGGRASAPSGLEPIAASRRNAWRTTLVVLVPLAFVLAGFVVAARRRRAPVRVAREVAA